MDPTSLTEAAMNVVVPYLTQFGVNLANDVSASAAKSLWDSIKSKLTGAAGREVVAKLEQAPAALGPRRALEGHLITLLEEDPDALAALAKLLGEQGVAISTQTANVVGRGNKVGQASHGGSVKIN